MGTPSPPPMGRPASPPGPLSLTATSDPSPSHAYTVLCTANASSLFEALN
jgi:hypothetical protein